MTNNERIQAIQKRVIQASDGPWSIRYGNGTTITDPYGFIIDEPLHNQDAQFIAQAREDVPFLLSLLEQRDKTIADSLAERDKYDLYESDMAVFRQEYSLMLSALEDGLDMCDDYTEFNGDAYSMIGRHLRDTITQVDGDGCTPDRGE